MPSREPPHRRTVLGTWRRRVGADAVVVFVLMAWGAQLVVAQDAPRSKGKRRHEAASAKAPTVEVLTPSMTPAEAHAHARTRVKVVMYSAQWCGICDIARAYFLQH